MNKCINSIESGLALGIISSPAGASILTGRYPLTHGIFFNDKPLADGITSIAEELIEVIGSESKDFAVKGGLAQPVKNSMLLSIFSIIWITFTNIFVMADFGSLFRGKKNGFSSNGASAITGQGNLEEIIVPAIIIGIYLCGLNEKI